MTERCAVYKAIHLKFCSRLRSLYFAQILILNEFKLRKFCLFLQEWRFGRSRSSEIIDFGANRKHVCDFLLVRNSNLSPILHRFGDMPAFMCSWPHPYSTLILGVFPLHQIAHVGVSQRISLKLFGREIKIIVEEFQRTWARYRYLKCVTDRQTDSQTLFWVNTALCIASRWKKKSLYHEFEFMICRPTYHELWIK